MATSDDAGFPVILQASQVQFAPLGRLDFPRVESRMVFLCRAGTGTVRINRHTYQLEAGMVFVLPWGHAISYAAGEVDPFLVGGAHLVPRHDPDKPIRPTIPHGPRHELAGCGWRRDDPGLGGQEVVTTTAADRSELFDITVHAIGLFARAGPTEAIMRALGTLVAQELTMLTRPPSSARETTLPADLRRVLSYVDRKLGDPLTTSELADVGGISDATLTRRFREHLAMSPMAWVNQRRLERATDLLRTTTLPIAQVARRCGVNDPYYFSRLFREHVGESPSAWRQSHHLL